MPPTEQTDAIDRVLNRGEAAMGAVKRFFAGYFWAILKNVVGWLLILLAFPVGIALPGPGGLPMFLLGFALVAFPGKRRITSHVLRGRPLRIEASIFTTVTTVASLAVIATLLWFVGEKYQALIAYFKLDPNESTAGLIAAVAGVCLIAGLVTVAMVWLGLQFTNKLIRIVPKIRRLIRPLLRKWGIVLLPPPKKGETNPVLREAIEILQFSDTSRVRMEAWWQRSKPWVWRIFAVLLTACLFYFVIEPVVGRWSVVEWYINRIRPIEFVAGVLAFAAYLILFRAGAWRTLVSVLGYPLPPAAALRIWSTSELSRYIPGGLWQLATRAFLARQLGVPAQRCVASHVTEAAVLLLANIMVGATCLIWSAFRRVEGDARWWVAAVLVMVPMTILLLIHPRVFYRLTNGILVSIGRPPLEVVVGGRWLSLMLVMNTIGTLLIGLIVWTLIDDVVGLPMRGWWIAAGAYSVAWTAGFIATWAPAGLGVREIVFMGTLLLLLPASVKQEIPLALIGVAGVLALVVRIWSTVGELIVAVLAYAIDLKGAIASLRGDRRGYTKRLKSEG